MAFPSQTTISIVPGLSIQLSDTSVSPSPTSSIIAPGQASFQSQFTQYIAALFTNSNGAYLQTPFGRGDGANFIPIIYVRNIDKQNPVDISMSTIGLGQTLTMRLFPGSFFFLWIPVTSAVGGGTAGIDSTTGIGIKAVAPTINSPVELFYAG